MSPEVDQILVLSAAQIGSNLAPFLPEGYAQGHASLLSLMMMLSAREYERAADIRAAENTDMRALFGELAERIEDSDLRAKLDAASATNDDSLAISALNGKNTDLRRLLIELQAHVEENGDRAAELRVWDVLRRSAARRLVKLA